MPNPKGIGVILPLLTIMSVTNNLLIMCFRGNEFTWSLAFQYKHGIGPQSLEKIQYPV